MKRIIFLFSISSLNFIFGQVGTTCSNPIIINSLPYTTADNTANYADNYDPDETFNPSCSGSTDGFGNFYHGGNDVIYSYTAVFSGNIKIEIPSSAAVAFTGMFVYTSCSDIGINYAACSGNVANGEALIIDDFSVTAGQTYYILISSWPDPQTVPYTLNITQPTLGVNNVELLKNKKLVYPNPAVKDLSFNSENDIILSVIYTMDGRKIQFDIVHNNTISVDQLPIGPYIIEFTDNAGNTSKKKFIKK